MLIFLDSEVIKRLFLSKHFLFALIWDRVNKDRSCVEHMEVLRAEDIQAGENLEGGRTASSQMQNPDTPLCITV